MIGRFGRGILAALASLGTLEPPAVQSTLLCPPASPLRGLQILQTKRNTFPTRTYALATGETQTMQLLYYSLALYLSTTSADPAPAQATTTPRTPCTIRSPTSGAFFDLQPLHILPPEQSTQKHPRDRSWNTTGWDYGYNFTLNFCGPVIEDVEDVVGVEKGLWGNVSAFYRTGKGAKEGKGEVVSLGMANEWPVIRGRKLVLNYTGGSPCGSDAKRSRDLAELDERGIIDDDDDDKKKEKGGKKHDEDDDDDDDEDDKPSRPSKGSSSKSSTRRKSTIISMLCDRDPLAPPLALSFVGTDPDECAYFFEARSPSACGGIETAKQTLSPSGVFGVIVLIAVIVYIVGGCVYSRMVLGSRGLRQLPNYALWAGIGGFLRVSS